MRLLGSAATHPPFKARLEMGFTFIVVPRRGKFFLIAVTAVGLGYVIGSVVQVFFPGITVPAP
jgi:hypothetical protein